MISRLKLQCALTLAMGTVAVAACEEGTSLTPLSPLAPPDGVHASVSPTGGPYTIDGVEYYEYEGEMYPVEGTAASILSARTTGDVWPRGGFVSAQMEYRGHDANQTTEWSLKRLNGTLVAGYTLDNFGVKSGSFLTRTRKMEGTLPLYHDFDCDVRLNASTKHEAWFKGFSVKSVGVGGSGDVPVVVSIELTKGHPAFAFSSMSERERLCDEELAPEEPSGGDGGGGDDDCGDYGCGGGAEYDTWCRVCVEWTYYDVDTWEVLYTVKECWTETMSCAEVFAT